MILDREQMLSDWRAVQVYNATAKAKEEWLMQYPVIVEHKNGVYRALIPALSDLSAEGASRDDAVKNAQQAAEAYLSQVEVTTIEINLPQEESLQPGTPQAWMKALEPFAGDEVAIREHFAEIAAERERQREEEEGLEAA